VVGQQVRSKPLAKRAFHSAVASDRIAAVIDDPPVGLVCESQSNRGTKELEQVEIEKVEQFFLDMR